jgi:hypothetical protein
MATCNNVRSNAVCAAARWVYLLFFKALHLLP